MLTIFGCVLILSVIAIWYYLFFKFPLCREILCKPLVVANLVLFVFILVGAFIGLSTLIMDIAVASIYTVLAIKLYSIYTKIPKMFKRS